MKRLRGDKIRAEKCSCELKGSKCMHDKEHNKGGEEKIMEYGLKCCETSLMGDVGMHDDLIKKSVKNQKFE